MLTEFCVKDVFAGWQDEEGALWIPKEFSVSWSIDYYTGSVFNKTLYIKIDDTIRIAAELGELAQPGVEPIALAQIRVLLPGVHRVSSLGQRIASSAVWGLFIDQHGNGFMATEYATTRSYPSAGLNSRAIHNINDLHKINPELIMGDETGKIIKKLIKYVSKPKKR